jgi:steroid 5-alpha reductase family enzyme
MMARAIVVTFFSRWQRAAALLLLVRVRLSSDCRHPNFAGEILFHLGVCGLAAQGGSLLAMGSALISPLMMVGVMVGAAKRLDKEGKERYSENEKWQEWAAKTPSLWPSLR